MTETAKPPIDHSDSLQRSEIESRFTYHAPKPDQFPRYQELREKAKELALVIARTTPTSREKSLALTHLQLSVMLANAAIACNE
jgi:hypothetical protein